MSTLVLELNRGPYLDSLLSKLVLQIGIPLCLINFLIGFQAVRRESNKLMAIFILVSLTGPCYIAYQNYNVSLFESNYKFQTSKMAIYNYYSTYTKIGFY